MNSIKDMIAFIYKWKLNHTFLANKMGIPVGSFKKKISFNQPEYRFTFEEFRKLLNILAEMQSDLTIKN